MSQLLLIVQIAGRRCALCAHEVKSVIELGRITPVPRAPDFVTGITTLRSQILTVIDCRRALGLAARENHTDDRAVVITSGGHGYALAVDAIEDITTATGVPAQLPGGLGPEWSRVARGVIETMSGPALLIDPAALFAGLEDARGESEAAA
jgi:purine-binding chemotaxis protein CheW